MENLLCIKGKVIGKGEPLVCVPVMEETKDGILRETAWLVQRQIPMIEWRLDAFRDVESLNAIREVLAELKPLVRDTIVVYTFRSKQQGGQKALPAEQIDDIRQIAAESDVADLIDLEYFEAKKPKKEIAALKARGAHIIASHHDFEQTPDGRVMRMLLGQMRESGADIVKLAVMPRTRKDVLTLLAETAEFHELYPDHPLITMSMGKLGVLSRVAGETFGSCVTFGAGAQASAPGQLPEKELAEVLGILHRALE